MNKEKIILTLKNFYNDKICAVEHFKEPFQILISCIISLRTKDEITSIASKRLFQKASTPYEMVNLTEKEISSLIYPAGFYKRKGKQIFQISKILIEKYNGNVPDDINKLLQLPGVGRKTANLVLGYALFAIASNHPISFATFGG
jgi:endonuclease-3